MGFLLGDVSQNRVVTVADLGQVNAQIAQVVAPATILRDVNASGTLTVADKGIANTQITKALAALGNAAPVVNAGADQGDHACRRRRVSTARRVTTGCRVRRGR